jgi:hypothetical protein
MPASPRAKPHHLNEVTTFLVAEGTMPLSLFAVELRMIEFQPFRDALMGLHFLLAPGRNVRVMYPLEMSVYSVVVVVRWECAESLFFGDFHISIRRGPRKNLIPLLGITTEKPTYGY